MDIQIDSREKARAIKKIVKTFENHDIKHFTSKLLVGDYMSLDNPRLIIDRKQNLGEVCTNVCQQHERFKRELLKANEAGIRLVLLIEHGKEIKSLEDVYFWDNPRQWKYEKDIKEKYGYHWSEDFKDVIADLKRKGTKFRKEPTSGKGLYRSLSTISTRYNVGIEFCEKKDTGKRIIEILGGQYG